MLQTIKKLLPNSLLSFYRKNLKKFHGNELLDKKMLKYINYKNGFYIEIGAHDGIINSNTYYYEKNLNWRGVLVEPSNYFKNLKKLISAFKLSKFNSKKLINLYITIKGDDISYENI